MMSQVMERLLRACELNAALRFPRVAAGVAVGVADRCAAGDEFLDAVAARHLLHAAGERLHAIGGLDADDVRAPLGQELGYMRSGPDDGDLGNADAGQGQRQFALGWRVVGIAPRPVRIRRG